MTQVRRVMGASGFREDLDLLRQADEDLGLLPRQPGARENRPQGEDQAVWVVWVQVANRPQRFPQLLGERGHDRRVGGFSTVEMRAALVRETCSLLNLGNVRVGGHHVHIDGTLGSYSVHLGSANTHVQPGRMLFIVSVHSQYRGRLFLPFADDDPKTAEVLSKTLLLARDADLKDPSILAQIRG